LFRLLLKLHTTGIGGQITPARRHETIPHARDLSMDLCCCLGSLSRGGGALTYRMLVIETYGRLKTKRPLA
jgi:hypothetical protein